MPWCPKCKYEYQDGFSKCSSCDVELVSELPKKEDPPSQALDSEVLLISVSNEIEASIIESKLSEFGIPVMKKHKESGAYLELLMGGDPFGIDLFVPSRSLEKAKEIVKTDTSDNENELKEVLQEQQTIQEEQECKNFVQQRRLRAWIFLLILGSGTIIAVILFLIALIS